MGKIGRKGWLIAVLLVVMLLCSACVGGSSSSGSSKYSCGHASCKENGPFWCMGKNDTCKNQTYCAYELYCDECKR